MKLLCGQELSNTLLTIALKILCECLLIDPFAAFETYLANVTYALIIVLVCVYFIVYNVIV